MNNIFFLIIILLPLIGGLFQLLFLKSKGHFFSLVTSLVALLVGYLFFVYSEVEVIEFQWLLGYKVGFLIDGVSLLLVLLMQIIATLVSIFSVRYMKNDSGYKRYFAYLGLFLTAMTGLFFAHGLMVLFVFWEVVGISSYLLISFWYKNDENCQSASSVFLINKVADAFLLIGIVWTLAEYPLFDFTQKTVTLHAIPSLFILIGSFGKSAQFPFSGWLIKAMKGPTPISALIHAATMVVAGVFLIFRLSPVLPSWVLEVGVFVGIFTAIYGALCALAQNDIKKILAYSTISQLGMILLAICVGGSNVALIHIWNHAFFKSTLFMVAGAISYYLAEKNRENKSPSINTQDVRAMGGLQKALPWICVASWIAALALSGVPFFTGFISKEGIMEAVTHWASLHSSGGVVVGLFYLLLFLTPIYIIRLILLTFHGEKRNTLTYSIVEPLELKFPILVASAGAFWCWYHWNPFESTSWIIQTMGVSPFSSSVTTAVVSSLITGASIGILLFLFKKKLSLLLGVNKNIISNILYRGFYIDTPYNSVERGCKGVALQISKIDGVIFETLWKTGILTTVIMAKIIGWIDKYLIDGVVNFVPWLALALGRRLARLNARQAQIQLLWLLFAFFVILIWTLTSNG